VGRILVRLAIILPLLLVGSTATACEACAQADTGSHSEAKKRKPKKNCPEKRKDERKESSPTTVAILVCNDEDRVVKISANGSGYRPKARVEVVLKIDGPNGWKRSAEAEATPNGRGSWSIKDFLFFHRAKGTYRLSVEVFQRGRSVDVDSTECKL
jgi:hypothetical protein